LFQRRHSRVDFYVERTLRRDTRRPRHILADAHDDAEIANHCGSRPCAAARGNAYFVQTDWQQWKLNEDRVADRHAGHRQ
jgi:hypothetical protein